MSPTFSIIIPAYNVAKYLRVCLDSVLRQTYESWEAICVDDGALDESGSILDEYAIRDSRFHVIHQKNAGVSAARNAAMETIRGEWFLFLDGDDLLRPDALENIYGILKTTAVDGLLFKPYEEILKENDIGLTHKPFEIRQFSKNGYGLMTNPLSANGYPFGRIYKTEVFKHLRFPKGIIICEDVGFWADAISVPANWCIVNGSYYLYRLLPNSACHGTKKPPKFYKDLVWTLRTVVEKLTALGATPTDLQQYFKQYHVCYCVRFHNLLEQAPFFEWSYSQTAVQIYDIITQYYSIRLERREKILLFAARLHLLGPTSRLRQAKKSILRKLKISP